MKDFDTSAIHGRGTASNPPGRFERLVVEPDTELAVEEGPRRIGLGWSRRELGWEPQRLVQLPRKS